MTAADRPAPPERAALPPTLAAAVRALASRAYADGAHDATRYVTRGGQPPDFPGWFAGHQDELDRVAEAFTLDKEGTNP